MESKRAAIARARIQTATMGESMTRQHGCGEDKSPTQCLFFEIMPFSFIFFFLCDTSYAYLCTTIYGFIVFFVVAAISGFPPYQYSHSDDFDPPTSFLSLRSPRRKHPYLPFILHTLLLYTCIYLTPDISLSFFFSQIPSRNDTILFSSLTFNLADKI